MAIDPFTIARLGLGAGQALYGISRLGERQEDQRGQERIRRLLQQAQATNLRQGQAIAGSGAGISPALAQRAALQSVSEANQAATASAMDQEAALALADRERTDRLVGAELGALGAFGGQVLTALQGEEGDDDEAEKLRKQEEALKLAGSAAQAATAAGEAAPAATVASEAAGSATPSPATAASAAANRPSSILDRFLSTDPETPALTPQELATLEASYAGDPLPETARGLSSPGATPVGNLGMRAEDISIGLPSTRTVGRGTKTEQIPLTDEVQSVIDSSRTPDPFGVVSTVSRRDIEDRNQTEVSRPDMTNPYDVGSDLSNIDPLMPSPTLDQFAQNRGVVFEDDPAPTTEMVDDKDAIGRDYRLALDAARREAEAVERMGSNESILLPETDLAGRDNQATIDATSQSRNAAASRQRQERLAAQAAEARARELAATPGVENFGEMQSTVAPEGGMSVGELPAEAVSTQPQVGPPAPATPEEGFRDPSTGRSTRGRADAGRSFSEHVSGAGERLGRLGANFSAAHAAAFTPRETTRRITEYGQSGYQTTRAFRGDELRRLEALGAGVARSVIEDPTSERSTRTLRSLGINNRTIRHLANRHAYNRRNQ